MAHVLIKAETASNFIQSKENHKNCRTRIGWLPEIINSPYFQNGGVSIVLVENGNINEMQQDESLVFQALLLVRH